ncbi:MAG: hypothetical protein GC152_07540 [Alphaproteobacteria bacterium]|nr:hypothetical protein [Alphaproteobacteria bacterium]
MVFHQLTGPAFRSSVIAGLVGASWAALAAPASAATYAGNAVSLRDITADVRIVTAEREDIDVTIRQGTEFQTIRIIHDEKAGRVTLQGEGWNDPEGGCCDSRITREFEATADREKNRRRDPAEARADAFKMFPVIEIAMPRTGAAEFDDVRMLISMGDLAGGVVMDACYAYGEIGDLEEAAIGIVDGSRLVVGDVRADLEIDLSGDADIRVGNAGAVDVDVSGSGEAVLATVDGMLDVSIAGSGLVRAARLDGPLTTRIAGSGDVYVQSGRADPLKAIIQGSGSVTFEGPVGGTDLRLSRSAIARLGSVNGRVNKTGSGVVFVNGRPVDAE